MGPKHALAYAVAPYTPSSKCFNGRSTKYRQKSSGTYFYTGEPIQGGEPIFTEKGWLLYKGVKPCYDVPRFSESYARSLPSQMALPDLKCFGCTEFKLPIFGMESETKSI